ncbi:zinc metalloprotease HtpX [Rossellomorea sp. LjRoot5]|uniref:zinc metalloprotease HtpX n=1 Tax=Rossellomorea sp. LjRoot5 TaxID=3342331 RepID=UPI003ECD3352
MYFVDFAKRLFKKQNTGIIIYLILNTLIVMALFQDIFVGLSLYLVSLTIALSPVGEWMLRVQQGCKPLSQEYIDRLMPLFEEVYEKAKMLDPSIADHVKLFISNDSNPNAFATGRKTICLTSGLLQYSDEQIKATLAHEFGHLSNKDTDLILIVSVGNMIVSTMFVLYRVVMSAVGIMASIANRSFGTLIMTIFIDFMLVAMMWLWTKFGTMLVMHSSRKNEYEADHFAYQLGYGDPLIQVLNSFNEMEMSFRKGLWANLASSHPESFKRIESEVA